MFSCSYRYSKEDNYIGTKYTCEKNYKKSMKIVLICFAIALICTIIDLAICIASKDLDFTIVWIVCPCFIISLTLLLCTPRIQRLNADKAFEQNFQDMDNLTIDIDLKNCSVSFSNQGVEKRKVVLDLNKLVDVYEDEERLVLVFNINQFVVIRKDSLQGELDLLKSLLEKNMNKKIILKQTKKSSKN